MLEAGLGADLPLESLHAQRGAQGGVQHLERHPAPVAEVLGQIHRRAAAPAQLLLDQVELGELRREEIVGDPGRRRDSAWVANRVPRSATRARDVSRFGPRSP